MDFSTENMVTPSPSPYNFNFKTVFLILILICACCMFSIGYNWNINKLFDLQDMSFWVCILLTLFLFYVLYEFFKSDTCEDLSKSGWDRLGTSFSRGRSYMGQKGTQGLTSMGNAMNLASERMRNARANRMTGKNNALGLSMPHQNSPYMTPNYNPIENPVQSPMHPY